MTPLCRRHLEDRQVQQRWLDPRLPTVRVQSLRAYLLSKGWEVAPSDHPRELVFREPVIHENGPLYQWLPASETGRDYVQRIYEAIAAIAEVEDRFAGDVLSDVLRQPSGGVANGTEAGLAKARSPK